MENIFKEILQGVWAVKRNERYSGLGCACVAWLLSGAGGLSTWDIRASSGSGRARAGMGDVLQEPVVCGASTASQGRLSRVALQSTFASSETAGPVRKQWFGWHLMCTDEDMCAGDPGPLSQRAGEARGRAASP